MRTLYLSSSPTHSHFPAQRPRQVGVCLKHLPSDPSVSRFHNENVPWQRVINAKGIISPRYSVPVSQPNHFQHSHHSANRSQPSGAQNQAEALRAEGVRVTANAMGELLVDFDEFGWFPDTLPSEA